MQGSPSYFPLSLACRTGGWAPGIMEATSCGCLQRDMKTPRERFLSREQRFRGVQSRDQREKDRRSSAAGQFCLDGDVQVGLMHPPAGVRRAVPALQRDGTHVVAFFVVENLEKGRREVGAYLGGRPAEVD